MGRRSSARGRLVATAHDLFRDPGFDAVSVAHLCQAAGVNKGSFYHFFSSKRELLLEVIGNAWDETGLLADWGDRPPAAADRATPPGTFKSCSPITTLTVKRSEEFEVHCVRTWRWS